jgi:serine protein kinase
VVSNLFGIYSNLINERKEEEFTLEEFLNLCKTTPAVYATAAERMIAAIGEPETVDTSTDSKLSRVFQNKPIKRYKPFEDFYGMEETIERIVGYFRHAAQGLEEKKQILYLLGPVGSAKSSIAERLKELMQKEPIYVLKYGNEISPVFESPFGLFSEEPELVAALETEYNIPSRYVKGVIASPWAVKRLSEIKDIRKFKVIKIWPNKLNQVAIIKTEPGDENNQDISSLVGKIEIRKLEYFAQHDTDAYGYNGALCRGNQGIVEFVEMFKAPIKVLHPLLTATQEGNYKGTEDGLGAIPFQGVVLAHSNESEWQTFRNNKNNEAFIDRIYIVKVPYCLRRDEELKIYKKMLENSQLANNPCAPKTLELLADFSVLTRLKTHENNLNLVTKMRVYNGENLKNKDPNVKAYQEYTDAAGVNEGMSGSSTRFAFKVLSQTFNFDKDEIAADPIHLMYVLENAIKQEQFSAEKEELYIGFIKSYMAEEYKEFIGTEIQRAYVESFSEYGQNVFETYLAYADSWLQDIDYRDPNTGEMFDRSILNDELEKIEKPAGIANPKDFRSEVVNFVLRSKAKNRGASPRWNSYEKLAEVIEKKIFSSTEDLLPIISLGTKANKDDEKKRNDFVSRMKDKGYSERQINRLTEWFIRARKSS